MTCQKNHPYLDILSDLPPDQSGGNRHRCAGCAFEQGLIDGLNQVTACPAPNLWGASQAGTGRHKDCNAAYQDGYDMGLLILNARL